MKKFVVLSALVVFSATGLIACSSGEKPTPKKPAAEAEMTKKEPAKPAATAVPAEKGAVEITVSFTGEPPKMPRLRREADPFCAKEQMNSEEVVINENGTLMNAIVYVNGVPGTYPAPTAEIVLDQTSCMYRPRVSVAQADQKVTIRNSDQTLHNVHTYDGKKTLFNQAQPPGAKDIEKTFEDGARVIKYTCDVHPWMTGYQMINHHPFHAVTGESGMVKLEGVPIGKYTVEIWHEKYGSKSVEVMVAANQTASAQVSYNGTETGG